MLICLIFCVAAEIFAAYLLFRRRAIALRILAARCRKGEYAWQKLLFARKIRYFNRAEVKALYGILIKKDNAEKHREIYAYFKVAEPIPSRAHLVGGKLFRCLCIDNRLFCRTGKQRVTVTVLGGKFVGAKNERESRILYFKRFEKVYHTVFTPLKNAFGFRLSGDLKVHFDIPFTRNRNRVYFGGEGRSEGKVVDCNLFSEYEQYLRAPSEFCQRFDEYARLCGGDRYKLYELSLKKIAYLPDAPLFENEYLLCQNDGCDVSRSVEIFDILGDFGFPFVYNAPSLDGVKSARHTVLLSGGEAVKPSCVPNDKGTICKSRLELSFADEKLDDGCKRLKESALALAKEVRKCCGVSELLLSAFCMDADYAREAIRRSISMQTLEGKFVNYEADGISMTCKNEMEYLIVPAIVAALSRRFKLYDVLDEKSKYAFVCREKSGRSNVIGRVEREYPADFIIQHLMKCFTDSQFSDRGMTVSASSSVFGFFKGAYKSKSCLFALIYAYSLTKFSPCLKESGLGCELLGFLKTLKIRLKSKSFPVFELTSLERVAIAALQEGIYGEKQFTVSMPERTFADIFERYSFVELGNRTLDTFFIYLYLRGLLSEGLKDAAFQLFCEVVSIGKLREKIVFQSSFRFSGRENKKLDAMFYGLLVCDFAALAIEDDYIKIGTVCGGFDGCVATVHGAGGSTVLKYFKRGASRIVSNGVSFVNVNALPVCTSGVKEFTVEF